MNAELIKMGERARAGANSLLKLGTQDKNRALLLCADALEKFSDEILSENKKDIDAAVSNGISGALTDRLTLNAERISGMAAGLRDVAALPDPVGEGVLAKTLPNGLKLIQKRVPMGVIGIIYEARPNVTADAFGLCLKAGSAVILRGGKEALRSNLAIVALFRRVLAENGFNQDIVQILKDTSHETAAEFMRLNGYLDVLIPRGGASLIQTVVTQSTVPVIETGVGNCHVYVDKFANLEKAVNIVVNAKTHRPGVCNAAESLIIHEDIAEKFVPMIFDALSAKSVEIRGDEKVCMLCAAKNATEDDWGREYLDYIISAKTVASLDEAIDHINRYGTKHSEAIVSEDYTSVQRFLEEVDAAAVYANASTRFTDGGEFGLGAEIGISTQKLHARGPMGLKELTTTKFIIYGNGQIR